MDTTREKNLYEEMETERVKLPNVLREDYLPVFIVRSLQEILCTDFNSAVKSDKRFRMEEFFPSNDEIFTHDTLLEDNADFEGTFLIQDNYLSRVGNVLKFAQNAIDGFLLEKSKLLAQFVSEFEHPDLELLYFMDSEFSVLNLASYILRLQDLPQKRYFRDQFLEFSFSPLAFSSENGNRDRSCKILEKFLQVFIQMYYCNPGSKQILVRGKKFAGNILKKLAERLTCNNEKKPSRMSHDIMLSILKEVNIPQSVRSRYIKDQFMIILKRTPIPTQMDVLQCQEAYAERTKLISLEYFSETIKQMIRWGIDDEQILSVIISSCENPDDYNWELMLYIVTIWIDEKKKKATTLLSDFVKTQIRHGLQQQDENMVISGFIVARHCCLVAPDLFLRYINWYMNMFQAETYSPASTVETFKFLTELLTKWVTVEPTIFLHTHISYRPFIPTGCRECWNDYLALANARVAEYKEVEAAMECEPNLNDPVQHDVEMAIKAFQVNKKIPQNIYKMWMLQRQRYLKEFLPALLRKPPGIALTDARPRLIELLRKDDKIPTELYTKYKTGATS